jgi:putative tryptophan/tyrosine transport system substrate-binding protein
MTATGRRISSVTRPGRGFLRSSPAAPFQHLTTAFRQGLNEAGFVEGQNVAIEYRYADNQLERRR